MKLRNIKEDVEKISNADTLHLACKDQQCFDWENTYEGTGNKYLVAFTF